MPNVLAGTNPIPSQVEPEWRALLAKGLPPNQDLYEDVFANSYLMPLQRKNEMRRMIALARTFRPNVVMEIGADKGGGFFHFVNGLMPDKAIAIEYRGVPYLDTFAHGFPKTQFLGIGESSYAPETIARVSLFLHGSAIDVLFIDGDKFNVQKDVDAYLPMMRKGGVIFIHDITDDIPMQHVFQKLGKAYKTEIIYDGSEGMEAQAREKRGELCGSSYEQWLRVWGATSCGVGVVYV